AISYAGRGAVVTVRVVQLPDQIVLEVEDNGSGLSAEQMAAAVQSRRGSSRPLPHLEKGQANGTGLGLAVAVEISELFGARFQLSTARSGSGLLASTVFVPVDR
ncbi:MAG: hypothetical protein RLZZ413_2088, partial [Pseudomonadota bacterium]